jgi:NAD(P)-dependent dehydrogenase (short-subunit alcohol dehydrogenase family)
MPTASRFEGKVCVITGSASGIGRAVLVRLVSEGARAIGVDLNAGGLAESAELAVRAAAHGGRARVLTASVAEEADIKRVFDDVVRQEQRLDVLVNMAGVLRSRPTTEVTAEEFEALLRVNLLGTFLCCREALPHLLATHGNIVNAASMSAFVGHPYMAGYSASKGGVVALTHALSREYLLRGVRVNAVAPGGILTGMAANPGFTAEMDPRLFQHVTRPDRLLGEPEQVAGVVAMLASEDGGFVNGEVIRVDGGTHG